MMLQKATVLRTAARVLAISVGTVLVGMVGTMIGLWQPDETIIVVMRSLLMLTLLLAMTRAFQIRDRRAGALGGRSYRQVLIAAALAFVVSLASWGGRALFGQMLVPAGFFAAVVFSALIDFVAWMAVAILGVLLGDRARAQATVAPAPYA